MENSENLRRLALLEVRSITDIELKNLTEKHIHHLIHKLLPILNYLGEYEFHEKILEIKRMKNLKIQKKEFQKTCELIRENIQII
ncbi:hypothetical protein [Roseobacter sp. HKCCA2468]|uniref:hypothetical protein n=1 Tax=Roseobacter sp. HKCCA2468 TaxID=3120342 RepID=UPI0030ED5ADF